jgi:ATP-dependent RNA helicase DeaD
MRRISQIERITKAKIEKVKLPKVENIVNVLTEKAFEQFDSSIESFDEEGERFEEFKARFADKSQDEIMKGLYAFIFEQSLKRYKKAKDIDIDSARRERGERGERGARGTGSSGAQVGYDRYHITIGKTQGLEPGRLINFVSRSLNVKGSEIGKISILNDFSFFELPERYNGQVLSLGKQTYEGNSFNIQLAKARENRPGRGRRNGNRNGNRSGGGGFRRSGNREGGNREGGRSFRRRS